MSRNRKSLVRRGGNGRQGGSMDFTGSRGRMMNWVVGGNGVNPAGAQYGNISWPGPAMSCLIGQPTTQQLYAINAAGPLVGGVPTVGEVEISGIFGSVFLSSGLSLAGYYTGAVGIYVAKQSNPGNTWELRDPAATLDASKDDYLFIRPFAMKVPGALGASDTTPFAIEIPVAIPGKIIIGSGQALHLAVGCGVAPAAGLIQVNMYVRTAVDRDS